ncbi:preprotein translocase subunit SecG [Candidatus Tachikawaea gelatinosa]|uniref:Protein-export membrane protein SecG n=1 Tax=Candidatus Tachikawaea gelatinosa TaxID=1410383 RepID=A0A090AR60_9ENTR|nr:preprotein translocase subunit SecG [Candidatus Tachikawaea gelatinosa]BAP58857.1 preprotein translocase subunit SecG [Candidatus Tachikawaea gelatinosa]
MYKTLLIVFSMISISLVGLIILQKSKGTNITNSLNSDDSSALFGYGNTNNIFSKIITILASLFFIISLLLGNLNNSYHSQKNLQKTIKQKNIQKENNNEIPE